MLVTFVTILIAALGPCSTFCLTSTFNFIATVHITHCNTVLLQNPESTVHSPNHMLYRRFNDL